MLFRSLKQVRCAGEDYTARPISFAPDQVVDDCTLLLSREVAEVSGGVTDDHAPAEGLVVVLVPADMSRRRLGRHTASG